jgi:aryl-alcohol dehydrogenase (NADP+)
MEYRSVGASGLKVTPICLGTMMFGARTDEARSGPDRPAGPRRGVNFIDTADYYADGRGEAMVGDLIAPDRDQWVVATKVGFRTGPGANEDGTSAVHVRRLSSRA